MAKGPTMNMHFYLSIGLKNTAAASPHSQALDLLPTTTLSPELSKCLDAPLL